jgi:hypothetical protein
MKVPLARQAGEPSKLHASDQDRKLGSPNISEVLRRRDIAPKADGAPYGVYIVLWRVGCQQSQPESYSHKIAAPLKPDRRWPTRSRGRPAAKSGEVSLQARPTREEGRGCPETRGIMCGGLGHAALRPHSSAVLGVLVGGVGSGVICARVTRSVTRPAVPENRLKRWLKGIGK